MTILELENKHIKIGRTSITVINTETDKTCGVVRNIRIFRDLAVNKQMEYFKPLRSAGLWGCGIDGIIDAVIISENQLYYLHNLKPIETYNKLFKGVDGWESERKRAEERQTIAENMKQFATVINCYID